MIKISQTSKIRARSWSLNAIETCAGSINPLTGGLVDACQGCYATTGNYRYPNVREPRTHNKTDWKRPEWVSDMVNELDNDRYFRWFDSGDLYHPRLADKIYQVIKQTPHCNHWLPTRQYKVDKFKKILDKINSLKNCVVRFSSDSVIGKNDNPKYGSVVGLESHLNHTKVCEAYKTDKRGIKHSDISIYTKDEKKKLGLGNCGTCRACWDKSIPVIGYIGHGLKMGKLIAKRITEWNLNNPNDLIAV